MDRGRFAPGTWFGPSAGLTLLAPMNLCGAS